MNSLEETIRINNPKPGEFEKQVKKLNELNSSEEGLKFNGRFKNKNPGICTFNGQCNDCRPETCRVCKFNKL